MTPVEEQFLRVKRWHNRFGEITRGHEHNRESDYYQDVVYAFFQNFWSLKDWIINSKSLDKKIVDDFFHSNTDMEICRDIANGSKHFELKNPSLPSRANITRRSFSLSIGGGKPQVDVIYWIKVTGRPPVSAYDLATTLVATCEGFLLSHKALNF